MTHAPDDVIVRTACARARVRLREGWGDPQVWWVLREEVARAWSEHPAVCSAVVVVRGAAADRLAGEEPAASWVLGSAEAGDAQWVSPPPVVGPLWGRLDASLGNVIAGAAEDLPGGLLPEGCARWLAVGAPATAPAELMVLLGLAESHDAADELSAGLLSTADEIAAFLGLRHRQVESASELAAAQAEAEALGRLERLRGRLAAVTAHELRTPLSSILAYTEVLRERADDPGFAQRAEFLGIIREEADRLARMVERLLDFSRRQPGLPLMRRQPCDVPALLADALRILGPQAVRREQVITCRATANLPPVDGDPDLLRQVFINLVGNALKFSARGAGVAVLVREDAAMVRVAVVDRGPGIPAGELRAIFQSFYRAHDGDDVSGKGLGLSIVKDIVDLHEGHVDVRSRQGRGSTFCVLLPKVQHRLRHADPFTAAGADPQTVEAICGHGLRLAAELTGARASAVCLRDGDGSRLAPTASQGLPPPPPHSRIPAEGSALATALRGEVVTVNPGAAPLPWPVSGRAEGWLAAPMLVRGRVVGVVVAAGPPRRSGFNADEAAMLRVAGETIAVALAAAGREGLTAAMAAAVGQGLRVLGDMRRGRIPTADPLALRLLAGTAAALGLSPRATRRLQFAGALHDVGMLEIDPDIVQKAARLSADEMDEITRHPLRGLDLLGPLAAQPDLREMILHHHEHVDGSGYPGSRRGGDIPVGARILAVVDAFFAMVRNRPYRERRSPLDVVAEIRRHAGTQFDPAVVEAFATVLQQEGLLGAAAEADHAVTTGRHDTHG
jgi:signal transduction histidine kinase/GAF domain-containing protein